ncbi:MAG: hypothetical protein FJW40_26295 [Acidobacteria bacterium]|nr:hypothetical protein [Acidobacteriota bacterium]
MTWRWTWPERLLGLRSAALLEIAIFFAGVLACGGLDGRFEQLNPHPVWFLVALIAAQYGTGEAAVAALAGSAFLRAGNLPQETMSTDLYGWIWVTLRLPLGWFLVSVLVGEVRRRHQSNENLLRRETDEAKAQARDLSAAVERMHRVKQGLETVIASQLRSAVTLYQAAKRVETLNTAQVLDGSLDLARAVLSCQQLSLYLVEGGSLVLRVAQGWAEDSARETAFPSTHPLFKQVVMEQKTLCVAREGDEHHLARQGLLAGPLIDPETGHSLGMLKVEKMGFLALNLSTLENFKAVCGWVSEAYSKAERHERAASASVFDADAQIYSKAFFERESQFLVRLGRRLKFAVSVLQVDLAGRELTSAEKREAAEALSAAVAKALRTVDLAFSSGQDRQGYTVLLPATPVANAPIVAAKLEQAFSSLIQLQDVALRISWQSLHEPPAPQPPTAQPPDAQPTGEIPAETPALASLQNLIQAVEAHRAGQPEESRVQR